MFQNLLKKIHTILKELILFKEIEMQDNELNPDALEIISPLNMELKDVSSNDGKIIVKFEDEKKYIIKIYSLDTGTELKSILISK